METPLVVVERQGNNHPLSPYSPAHQFQEHHVKYITFKGVEEYVVCSDYQIHENMVTMYNVKKLRNFHVNNSGPSVLSFKSWGGPSRPIFEAPGYNVSVDGFVMIPCKTIAREKISDMESTYMRDPEGVKISRQWWEIDETMATTINIDNYNHRVESTNSRNKNTLSENYLLDVKKDLVSLYEKTFYNDKYDEWKELSKFKKLWIKAPTPDSLKDQMVIYVNEMIQNYYDSTLDLIKYSNYPDQLDLTYFDKHFNVNKTKDWYKG